MAERHPVVAYCRGVLDGSVPASLMIRKAVERHVRDLETGKERGLHFDRAAAEHVVQFFGLLKHSKGEWAGQTIRAGALAAVCAVVALRLEAGGWIAAVPDGIRRGATQKREDYPFRRDRAVPDDRRRGAGGGDLQRGDEAGPGENHLGGGGAHGGRSRRRYGDDPPLASVRHAGDGGHRPRSSCRWAPMPTRWMV